MARLEILDPDHAPLGNGAGVADMLFELGMMYSVGRDVPIDLISAHKWFNLAAAARNGGLIAIAARSKAGGNFLELRPAWQSWCGALQRRRVLDSRKRAHARWIGRLRQSMHPLERRYAAWRKPEPSAHRAVAASSWKT